MPGQVVISGTPGEENCGGKEMLLQKDGFSGIDVALTAHPGTMDAIEPGFFATQHVRLLNIMQTMNSIFPFASAQYLWKTI